jgi:4'-phosphopantetheinyl transferase
MPSRIDLVLLDLRDGPPLAALRLQRLERLSPDERERYARYREPQSARRFALARLALRERLAEGRDEDPAAIALVVDERGKPRRADDTGPHFNLSHAGDRIVIACSDTHEVGVDVERPEAFSGRRSLWRSVCSPAERAALAERAERSPAEADAAFGRLWTRKEALAKAVGAGLHWPFDRIDLADALDTDRGVVRLLRPDGAGAPRVAWSSREDLGDGPAALAVVLHDGEAREGVGLELDVTVRRVDPQRLASGE